MIVGRKYAVPEAMIFCSCMEVSCFNITKVWWKVYEERLTIINSSVYAERKWYTRLCTCKRAMGNVNSKLCARVNERWVM